MEVIIPSYVEVLRVVRFYTRPPLDAEDIAANIVLEQWAVGSIPTRLIIRHRCWDAARKLRNEQKHLQAYNKLDRSALPSPFDSEQLGRIILATELTEIERRVLYFVYVNDLPFSEIASLCSTSVRKISDAQWTGLEKLKQTARVMYG